MTGGQLPPVYFAVGAEVFQNRRGTAALVATAINDVQAALVCASLNGRADAMRWRTAVRLWKAQRLRPPQVGLDRGNDCYDTFEEAADAQGCVQPENS